MTSRIARIWLVTVMFAALACALVAWVTSGFVWQLGPLRISLRDPFRPIVVAVLCGVGLRWIAPDSISIFAERAQRMLTDRTAFVTIALSIAVVVSGIRSGTHVASASDPYGYVSQADLWLSGDLRIDQRLELPAPFGDFALAPLGYRPGPEPDTIVPTYPPGLPLLMAAFKWVGGADGPYYVVPLLGGLLIGLTFLLGRRLFDEGVGFAASLLLAASPAFLNQLMVPMSDVPAAAAWTLALLLSVGGHSLAAGLASSLAIVIRPNLAPLALGVAVISIGVGLTRQQEQGRWIRTLLFAGGAALGVLGIAVLNAKLYGSPLASGYGSASTIYDWSNLRLNLLRYPRWLIETQTPFIIVGVLSLLGRWERSRPSVVGIVVPIGLGVFLVALFWGYFLYMPFEEWSYLRFLLPAFPVLLILAVAVLRRSGPRLGRVDQVAVTAAVVTLVLGWELSTGLWRGVFSQREPEQWYITIAREARMIAPPDAVFLCLQHSGSVRFYGGPLTVRYDAIEAGSLDRAIEILRAKGFHPYFLLDGWEEPRFQARFGQASAMGRLDWNPVRRWNSPTHAALYDSAAATPR